MNAAYYSKSKFSGLPSMFSLLSQLIVFSSPKEKSIGCTEGNSSLIKAGSF
jgi:hypothetical protein